MGPTTGRKEDQMNSTQALPTSEQRIALAEKYIRRYRYVTRIEKTEILPSGAVRVVYVGPSAAQDANGDPIAARFTDVVAAYEIREWFERGELEEVEEPASVCPTSEVQQEILNLRHRLQRWSPDAHTLWLIEQMRKLGVPFCRMCADWHHFAEDCSGTDEDQ